MPPAPIDVRDRRGRGFTGWRPIGPDTVIGIAVHHSVSGGLFFTAAQMTVDDELNHLLMIDAYHVSKGWGGFAYHLAAFPSSRCFLISGPRPFYIATLVELGFWQALLGPLVEVTDTAIDMVIARAA